MTTTHTLNGIRHQNPATMKTKKVIESNEWDALVVKTYGRIYNLQQQDGGMRRGTLSIIVPDEASDFRNDEVPEVANHEKRGVSFAAWLARDPKAPLAGGKTANSLDLWWERNFYPELQMVGNDLCAKGLLEAGKHTILIDW